MFRRRTIRSRGGSFRRSDLAPGSWTRARSSRRLPGAMPKPRRADHAPSKRPRRTGSLLGRLCRQVPSMDGIRPMHEPNRESSGTRRRKMCATIWIAAWLRILPVLRTGRQRCASCVDRWNPRQHPLTRRRTRFRRASAIPPGHGWRPTTPGGDRRGPSRDPLCAPRWSVERIRTWTKGRRACRSDRHRGAWMRRLAHLRQRRANLPRRFANVRVLS